MVIRRPFAQSETYQLFCCRSSRSGTDEQVIQFDAHAYDSRPNDVLPQKDSDDVTGGESLLVGRKNGVAVSAGVGGKIAGAMPANELHAGANAV